MIIPPTPEIKSTAIVAAKIIALTNQPFLLTRIIDTPTKEITDKIIFLTIIDLY